VRRDNAASTLSPCNEKAGAGNRAGLFAESQIQALRTGCSDCAEPSVPLSFFFAFSGFIGCSGSTDTLPE
jgi:hypothetical protein